MSQLNDDQNKKKKAGLAAFLAAIFSVGAGAQEAPDTGVFEIEEIIVTANKREQNIQDTGMSVTALSSEDIDRKGLVDMGDYLSAVPGVNFLEYGTGENQIVMRGIGIGTFEQSTVSTYFGEIPLTTPVAASSTDLKLVDMERVEVLRGPQGTLYGGGAMGGTIRNIPAAPDLTKFAANLDLGFATVDHSSDDNNHIVGAINFPLSEDQLALRVAAYRYKRAGYVDLVSDAAIEATAVATGSTVAIGENLNGHTYTGGRASLLWQLTDNLSITLMHLTQKLDADGRDEVNLSKPGYQATALNTGPEFQTEDFDATNLVVEYDLDWATLIASSSWLEGDATSKTSLARQIPWAIHVSKPRVPKKSFLQEVRLVSQLEGRLQFVVGLYYEDFENTWNNLVWDWTGDPALIPPFLGTDPNVANFHTETVVEQKAVFGELSYQLGDQWEFIVGGRWFDYDRRDITDNRFGTALTNSDVSADQSDFNAKVGINFRPNDNMLLYAQLAQGYRLGIGQASPSAINCDADGDGLLDFTNAPIDPGPVDSDTTDNFELGGKFTALDRRLTVNTTLFSIDWNDLPVGVSDTSPICAALVRLNAGKARSQGAELDASFYVTQNLLLSLSVSYVDAEFLSDNVSAGNSVGDRLPLSPRVNGNMVIQYNFDLADRESFVRADYGDVGSYLNNVAGSTPDSGNYGKLNLRAGMAFDHFNIEVYGTNLTDEDAHTMQFNGNRGWRLSPRTIGLDIRYRY